MAELRISTLENGFVLYFQTPEPRINAYVLASTLVAFADAAKAASRRLNSSAEVEIVVEALASGSFRARVSALVRQSGLFAPSAVGSIVLSVLSTYIYDHTLGKPSPVQIIVNTNEVIVLQGENRVVVPRNVYEATLQVREDPLFTKSVDRMFANIVSDERITGFGLGTDVKDDIPAIILPRELMLVRDEPLQEEEKTRIIEEECDLYIVKAIMERSKRKWEFKWHGITIPAPIKDPNFYDDFARHNFTIAPGDEFQARLAIHQKRDDVSRVYTNTSYEVLHVYRHISHPRPNPLPIQ